MARFALEEATVSTIHAAYAAGVISCVELVNLYLKRIQAYDKAGPAINAIIAVHPEVNQVAAELDDSWRKRGAFVGPLHGIPVILKDNYDTADMPTTGGSLSLAGSVPPDDAWVVRRLREAGAIILAKANLHEMARGESSVSSLGGQTRNPYDLTRTASGSSGGTAAAIAANFGVLGTGTDTGASIRSPAAATSIVGLRPTRGLISRDGTIALTFTQDAAGPMTRTVEDTARMLDVLVGFDPADPITALSYGKTPEGYPRFLDPSGLKGARLGVLTEFFGTDPDCAEVNAVAARAFDVMRGAGAELLPVHIEKLSELTQDIGIPAHESKAALNGYFASLGPHGHVKSLAEFVAGGKFHPSILARMQDGLKGSMEQPEYKEKLLRRERLRLAVIETLARHRIAALVYPHQRYLVAKIGEAQRGGNGVLSSGTGLPALVFPGGFSAPTADAPQGVPVGLELLGTDWSEPTLLKLAYSFEQASGMRRPPSSVPPLE